MTRACFRLTSALAALAVCAAPLSAHAWWNAEYKQRTTVTLNTSAAGVTTTEAVSDVAVPLRLHSGNFNFVGAKPDGSDLRVVAADDKTPLKFSIEKFDGANELAVVWVQVPLVAPGSDRNLVYVYAGNEKAGAEAPATVVDAGAAATLRFAQADGGLRDAGGGAISAAGPVATEANGLIGASARFDGTQVLEIAASDRLKAASAGPYSISLWARPTALAGTLLAQGPLTLAIDAGKVVVRLGTLKVEGGDLPPAAWVHLGLAIGAGKATLYVNGAQAGQGDLVAATPPIAGAIKLGQGFNGLLDELQIAPVLRSADWMKFTRAAQGADAKLVATQLQKEGEAEESGGSHNYFGILFKNLTTDAWVIIGICGLMFLVALWVMVTKTLLVRRIDRGNNAFLQAFRASPQVLQAAGAVQHPGSTLARLYDAGVAQLNARKVGQPGARGVTGATINAVEAAVHADLVRENQMLNSLMVLLTIAISGGPFLGLLGTVVGVMITFAAIAAAGDVNVNAIAPGIAAALLATVAGLGVAIPSLFGYNYLASRIKNISSDMQVFVDEFVTRVAEQFEERAQG
jgi:biopolymer transport protein ExbB